MSGAWAGVVATNTVGAAAVKTSLTIDNFDDSDNVNDAWGNKGAMEPGHDPAYNSIGATYDTTVRLGATGSSLKLQYTLTDAPWNGFWNQLAPGGAPRDLSIYRSVVFWIRGGTGGVEHCKLELANATTKGVLYLNGKAGDITSGWRQIRIPLSTFIAAGLGSLTNVKEFNFVFEKDFANSNAIPLSGTVYIDGLEFSTLD